MTAGRRRKHARSHESWLRTTAWIVPELLIVAAALAAARTASHALLASLVAIGGALGVDALRRPLRRVPVLRLASDRGALLLTSCILGLCVGEVALELWRPTTSRPGLAAYQDPDLPPEWRRRRAPAEGGARAYYWHGHLHVLDARGMRRRTPFPPRTTGVARILVLGDSLTYGLGVAAEEAYPAVLQQELSRSRPVEVLNLGVSGHQSEDVLEELRHFLPALDPDLVLYGVYLNDYLPSNRGAPAVVSPGDEVDGPAAPATDRVPLTAWDLLQRRSRLARLTALAWQKYRLRSGRDRDALTNILVDFERRQRRLQEDLTAMNELLLERGRPPLLVFVLNHHPQQGSEANRLTLLTEELSRQAGAEVIPAAPFLEREDGRDLVVSPWEGHPSAECHRLFAAEILPVLRDRLGRPPTAPPH